MGKVVGKALQVGALVAGVALAIPTGGTSLLAATLGVSSIAAAGIATSLSIGASLLSGTAVPKSEVQLGRLQARLDARTPRKMVLGRTAMPADIRYYEGSGEDERTIEYIVAVAAHRIQQFEELWLDDELAWSSSGGIAPQFLDYLGVEGYTEGGPGATRPINGGARWGADDRLTGCAYLYLRIERLGVGDDEQSPFANGLPSRVTIVGTGMREYDPRFDSTAGGSGSQRADNQNTWGQSTGNPIIQALNVLLGWRINGKLSVGAGIPPKYIDMDSVITAANICDESIALSGGGTQPRYRTAGAFSTNDPPMQIVATLLAGCAGDLLDSNGKLSFLIKANTLATPVVTLDEDDLLSDPTWEVMGGQTNLPNNISGSFTDPSGDALYQLVPYPSVSLPSEDGIERTAPLDLGVVENSPQAERLANQTLQRMQYPGRWSADYNMKGLAATVGSIVHVNHSPLAFVSKPFRVVSQKPSRSGRIALVLAEENASIYAWSANDSASVQPAAPVRFNPLNTGPVLLARLASLTANWSGIADDDGNRPANNATFNTGALADLDNVNLGDLTKTIGLLPTSRAVAALRNDNQLWSQVSGSGRPANNATVGANWSSNLSGRPTELTDGRVGSGLGSGGIVNANRVVTNSVAANAITTRSSAFTSGSFLISGNVGENTAQAVTLTNSGEPIHLLFSLVAAYISGSSEVIRIRLRRNGTQIASYNAVGVISVVFVDQPGAGSDTYTVTVQNIGSNNFFNISSRSLIALETKR